MKLKYVNLSTAGVGVMNATPKPRLNSITGPGGVKTPASANKSNKSNNGVPTENQLATPNAVGNRWEANQMLFYES